MKKIVIYVSLLSTAVILLGACKNNPKEPEQKIEPEITETTIDEPFLVQEEAIYDTPVMYASQTETSDKDATQHKTNKKHQKAPAATPKKAPLKDLDQNLSKQDIKPMKTVDTVFYGFDAQPISTTRTVISYEKKGKEVMKIISDPNNPDNIDYIVFTDKKNHKDIYNVQAGMSAKETKQLRKHLKHFTKKGKVFLYSEDSNILYELDGVTSDGKAVTEEDVDNMHVSSIIWKDKADKAYKDVK